MSEAAGFRAAWRAEVLREAPLIAPARQFLYPRAVPGEEDALARGALRVRVRPERGGEFLGIFALGFADGRMPSGVWACPNPEEMCAVAGGYAYVVQTARPEECTLLRMRPVVEVYAVAEPAVLVFAGHHGLAAWGEGGMAWETARLSWEGVRLTGVAAGKLQGWGWDLRSDREVEFAVDLRTGEHTGGAFAGRSGVQTASS